MLAHHPNDQANLSEIRHDLEQLGPKSLIVKLAFSVPIKRNETHENENLTIYIYPHADSRGRSAQPTLET